MLLAAANLDGGAGPYPAADPHACIRLLAMAGNHL